MKLDGDAAHDRGAESGQALPIGARFAGQYEVIRLLGAGGMGVVYEAKRDNTEAHVALKVLHRHLVANTQVVKRFYREANILRRLSGDHLVPLVDFGEDENGRLYMALMCIDGDALDRRLAVSGMLSIDDAIEVVLQATEALEVAHHLGVIHRDLKPANVLLEKMPNGELHARVCDFGLAKVLRESGLTSSALTDQNMVFGTPEYMSPEQVKGEEVDARADIYSAGVLLFELLTGKPPFRGKTGVATMTAHLTEDAPTPSSRAPDRGISPALDAVVLHALAKDRDDRYAGAVELREALLAARDAPDDPASTKPRKRSSDIAIRDTDLAIPPPASRDIDPLGTTAEHRAPSIRVQDLPRPQTLRSPPAGSVTPEALARSRPPQTKSSWMWIAVAIVAAIAGIAMGLVMARR